MACGDCCLPGCHVRERVAAALSSQGEWSGGSGTYVVVECSNAGCTLNGQLHKECYDRLERVCLDMLSASVRNESKMRANKNDLRKVTTFRADDGLYYHQTRSTK